VKSDRDCVDHLLMGNTDAALLASGLSPNERGRGLQYRPLAHHIVAPVVNSSNPVRSVSPDALRDLLSGKLRSWSDIGGEDLAVQPVCLPRFGGTTDHGQRLLQVSGPADPLAIRLGHSQLQMNSAAQRVLDYVSDKVDALGLVPLRHADGVRGVRILEVHDTPPGAAALERGVWPLGCTVGIAFHQRPGPALRSFLAYLDSGVCQRVLRQHFVALSEQK
jgi:phosphate transport system substrate-binding protein